MTILSLLKPSPSDAWLLRAIAASGIVSLALGAAAALS